MHLKVSGKRNLKLTETIKATAAFAGCTAKVTVAIQRFYSGSGHTIKTSTTTSSGTFSYVAADKTGKYRVAAAKFTRTVTPQHICTAATSASRTHSH